MTPESLRAEVERCRGEVERHDQQCRQFLISAAFHHYVGDVRFATHQRAHADYHDREARQRAKTLEKRAADLAEVEVQTW